MYIIVYLLIILPIPQEIYPAYSCLFLIILRIPQQTCREKIGARKPTYMQV